LTENSQACNPKIPYLQQALLKRANAERATRADARRRVYAASLVQRVWRGTGVEKMELEVGF